MESKAKILCFCVLDASMGARERRSTRILGSVLENRECVMVFAKPKWIFETGGMD